MTLPKVTLTLRNITTLYYVDQIRNRIRNLFEQFEFKLQEVKKEDQRVNVQVFFLTNVILCIYNSGKSFEVSDLLLKGLSNYKVDY